jgi:hypothetical protein
VTPDAAGDHHEHGGHHGHGRLEHLRSLLLPHQHDHADSLDEAMLADRADGRALAIGLTGLLATAALQAVIVAVSGPVGLLADTTHNFAEALTPVPAWRSGSRGGLQLRAISTGTAGPRISPT